MVVLIVAGLHVPVTPSSDVAGNTGAVVPWQIDVGIAANVGVMLEPIVMFIVTGFAH